MIKIITYNILKIYRIEHSSFYRRTSTVYMLRHFCLSVVWTVAFWGDGFFVT